LPPIHLTATGLFAIIAAALALWIMVSLARSRLSPFQCLLWALAYLLCKFLWRTRWVGSFDLPPNQGAVIVCNHRSSVDPFFIQSATGRKIHWMVAREFCEHPAFRWFLSACEVIPVGRGGTDTAALKSAMRIVAAGGFVGMLPEGRINMTTDLLLPARPGAALVALKSAPVVVPCYIEGAPYRRYPWSPFLMPAHVKVQIGKPIDLTEFQKTDTQSDDVPGALEKMLKGIATLAGRPGFVPQLAGRVWKPTAAELEIAMADADRRQLEQRK
jgi:1-acyl-sn-glycerol-3-phosphate acyltransferase